MGELGLGLRRTSRRKHRADGRRARRYDGSAGVALGDTTNVAARLQAAADPGTILVGQATARRLEHRFELGPPVDASVKGRNEPVHASRLVHAQAGNLPKALEYAERARSAVA
jgi:class 3 adenylate cyclase